MHRAGTSRAILKCCSPSVGPTGSVQLLPVPFMKVQKISISLASPSCSCFGLPVVECLSGLGSDKGFDNLLFCVAALQKKYQEGVAVKYIWSVVLEHSP